MARAKTTVKKATKKVAVKTVAKKTAGKKVTKKTTGMTKGSKYTCGDCGFTVTVNNPCGCPETTHLICCEKPMTKKR